MPKKPPRDNPRNRNARTVQSASAILHGITRKSGVMVTTSRPATPGGSIERLPVLEALRARLPVELRSRLIGCLEKPDELVLLVESAAWAGRLKLALSENTGLGGGRRVTIKLAPRGAA